VWWCVCLDTTRLREAVSESHSLMKLFVFLGQMRPTTECAGLLLLFYWMLDMRMHRARTHARTQIHTHARRHTHGHKQAFKPPGGGRKEASCEDAWRTLCERTCLGSTKQHGAGAHWLGRANRHAVRELRGRHALHECAGLRATRGASACMETRLMGQQSSRWRSSRRAQQVGLQAARLLGSRVCVCVSVVVCQRKG